MAASDLITASELKEFIPLSGTSQDTPLGNVIIRATADIETYLDRLLVTRGDITEYHLSGEAYAQRVILGPDLYMRQWPIISVTTIHESGSRVADATTLLDAASYVVNKAAGRITRVGGSTSGPEAWTTAYRGVKVVYAAGYANTAAVPGDIKDAALRLCALTWAEIDRKLHGVNSMSDALGNVTRYTAARLTGEMKEMLNPYRRRPGLQTGEVDA